MRIRNKHNGKLGTVIATTGGCNSLLIVKYEIYDFTMHVVPSDVEEV